MHRVITIITRPLLRGWTQAMGCPWPGTRRKMPFLISGSAAALNSLSRPASDASPTSPAAARPAPGSSARVGYLWAWFTPPRPALPAPAGRRADARPRNPRRNPGGPRGRATVQTKAEHPPRPAGSSEGGEHAACAFKVRGHFSGRAFANCPACTADGRFHVQNVEVAPF